MEKNVKESEKGGDVMADLLAALALLTFAGVAGLIAVLIALYAFSLASEAVSRNKNKDKEE